MVRYPKGKNAHFSNLNYAWPELLMVSELYSFAPVADIEEGRSFSSIKRINRNRTIQVTADADKEKANLQIIQEDIIRFMPDIVRDYPACNSLLEGEVENSRNPSEVFGWGPFSCCSPSTPYWQFPFAVTCSLSL